MVKSMLNENAQAIVAMVQSASHHPTALEVYETVKQQRPRIGLASIYRILRNLVEQGYIHELRVDGENFSRYDGHTERHDHAICSSCGRLLDLQVEIALSKQNLQEAALAVGVKLETYEIRLYGLCALCHSSRQNSANKEIDE